MENEKCLDTDALILVYKKGVKDRFQGNYITCITLFEFLRGIAYLGKNVDEFKEDIEDNFNVICLDNNSIKLSSRIYAELKEDGELIDDPDLLIGSICIANNLTLVTNNLNHFDRLKKFGLRVIKADEII